VAVGGTTYRYWCIDAPTHVCAHMLTRCYAPTFIYSHAQDKGVEDVGFTMPERKTISVATTLAALPPPLLIPAIIASGVAVSTHAVASVIDAAKGQAKKVAKEADDLKDDFDQLRQLCFEFGDDKGSASMRRLDPSEHKVPECRKLVNHPWRTLNAVFHTKDNIEDTGMPGTPLVHGTRERLLTRTSRCAHCTRHIEVALDLLLLAIDFCSLICYCPLDSELSRRVCVRVCGWVRALPPQGRLGSSTH
jgi:hypothetical protein